MPTRDISHTCEPSAVAEASNADTLKLATLRAAIEVGVAAIERGAYTDVNDDDLDAYLDGLTEQEHR